MDWVFNWIQLCFKLLRFFISIYLGIFSYNIHFAYIKKKCYFIQKIWLIRIIRSRNQTTLVVQYILIH